MIMVSVATERMAELDFPDGQCLMDFA